MSSLFAASLSIVDRWTDLTVFLFFFLSFASQGHVLWSLRVRHVPYELWLGTGRLPHHLRARGGRDGRQGRKRGQDLKVGDLAGVGAQAESCLECKY